MERQAHFYVASLLRVNQLKPIPKVIWNKEQQLYPSFLHAVVFHQYARTFIIIDLAHWYIGKSTQSSNYTFLSF